MNKLTRIFFLIAMLFGLSTSISVANENNIKVAEAATTLPADVEVKFGSSNVSDAVQLTKDKTTFSDSIGNNWSLATTWSGSTYYGNAGGTPGHLQIGSSNIKAKSIVFTCEFPGNTSYKVTNIEIDVYKTKDSSNATVNYYVHNGNDKGTSVGGGAVESTKFTDESFKPIKTDTNFSKVGNKFSVEISGTGLVINISAIRYTIEAAIAVPATSISLNTTTLTLTEGSTADLTATVLPDDTTDTVQWRSDDENVATVSDGKVTAKGVGSAKITATAGTVSATCTVEVTAIPLPEGQHISKITPDELAATTNSYTSFTYTDDYGTAYKGKTARNSNNKVYNIQLNNSSPNGIVVSANGNYAVRSITITWSTKTTNGRTIDIYGNYKAYSGNDAKDLYSPNSSTQGKLLGSLAYSTNANTNVSTLDVTDNYKYIGIRSYNGILYVEEISIIWEEATFEPIKLDAPTGFSFNKDTKTVSWNEVSDAASYSVELKNATLETIDSRVVSEATYTLPETIVGGEYTLTAIAKPINGSTDLADSVASKAFAISYYTINDAFDIEIVEDEDLATKVKIIYNLGEVFDPTGLVVNVMLPNLDIVDVTNEIEWPTEPFTTVGKKTITVTFNDLSATWDSITVVDPLPTDFAKVKTQTNLKFDYTRSTTTTSYGQDETITMSSFYSSVREDLDVTTETQVYSSSLSISFDKGTGTPPKYYANGNALRFYTNNTATVTVAEGVKSLVVTCSSDSYASALAKSTYTDATFNYKTGTNYVTINPTSRQFTIQGGGSQARIVSIEVQYSSTSVVTYKEFTNVQMQFKYDFDLSTYYTDHVSETGIMLTKDSTFTFDSDCITEEDFAEYQEAYGLAKSVNTTQKSTYKVAIDIPLDAESVRTNIYACAYIVVDGTYYFATEASNGTARGYSLASLLDAYGTNSELTTEQTQIVASLKEFIYSL